MADLRLESNSPVILSAVHQYLLLWSSRMSKHRTSLRILDFGCGSAEVVVAGRKLGLELYGVEAFYEGGSTRDAVAAKGLLGDVVRELDGGEITFASQTFDLVLSNQVFEHVENLDSVLDEISRVLKPAGQLLCLFPSRDVIREGHIGIPFAHRLPRGRLRFAYTYLLRRLGFGYYKLDKPHGRWAAEALDWIDHYTVYRRRSEVLASLSRHFSVQMIEGDYIRFRLRQRSAGPVMAGLLMAMDLPLFASVGRWLVRKLSGLVILAQKEST